MSQADIEHVRLQLMKLSKRFKDLVKAFNAKLPHINKRLTILEEHNRRQFTGRGEGTMQYDAERLNNLEIKVDTLFDQMLLIERRLRERFGPLSDEVVVKKPEPSTRPGKCAITEATRWLREHDVDIDQEPIYINDALIADPAKLQGLKDHMLSIEKQCSGRSFEDVWKTVKELERIAKERKKGR
jgi:hypothetical protein